MYIDKEIGPHTWALQIATAVSRVRASSWKQTGTKDELLVRLYARLGIAGPKQVPAALIFSVL